MYFVIARHEATFRIDERIFKTLHIMLQFQFNKMINFGQY